LYAGMRSSDGCHLPPPHMLSPSLLPQNIGGLTLLANSSAVAWRAFSVGPGLGVPETVGAGSMQVSTVYGAAGCSWRWDAASKVSTREKLTARAHRHGGREAKGDAEAVRLRPEMLWAVGALMSAGQHIGSTLLRACMHLQQLLLNASVPTGATAVPTPPASIDGMSLQASSSSLQPLGSGLWELVYPYGSSSGSETATA
jgi:hypothetical protein